MAVRFGVIGCGAIGQRRHILELSANKDAKVVALCDINEKRAGEQAARFNVDETYTDYREMLKKSEIDAVVVGTPNYVHAVQTIDSLKAGKHVLVEKPMATSRADAKKMIETAKTAKKFLMVGHNQRLVPGHIKAKELLDAGAIGKVLSFRTAFKHGGPEGWCIENSRNTWFFQKDKAVLGVTGDLGIHKADLMRYLLGEEFVAVGGFLATLNKKDHNDKLIQTDDNAYLTVKSSSGVIGSIIVMWTNYGEPEANYTYLYGTKGVMMISADPVWNVMVRKPGGHEEKYKVGAMSTNEKQVSSGVSDAFVESILKNKPPAIDGVEGYRSLDVILSAMDAAKTGKTVKIKHVV